jgi:3-phenylpropionate/trans-cinnamate dioxygenase ferredoxin reductase component
MSETTVIVGAGHAGGETAVALRMAGYEGRIVLIGDESLPPYSRPPLSKAYLAGKAEALLLRNAEWYANQRIAIRTGTLVTAVEPADHRVLLDDGDAITYDHLVLATGGEPRRITGPDLDRARNLHTLRGLDDAARLRSALTTGVRLVVIGAGYIGLEIAATARQSGAIVTVIEAAPRVLARVTSPPVSEFFQRVHREAGVNILLGTTVDGFGTDDAGDITAVHVAGQPPIPADLVLVGIGITPRTRLAQDAGLNVSDGIVVDEHMQTSAPDIYAVGDVARHPCPQHGGLRRVESVPNASEQARCVAATIIGAPMPYRALPWFWSDQYDVKLQSVGLAASHDHVVVRGNPLAGSQLTVLYLRGPKIIAADVIGSAADFAAAKRLIAAGTLTDRHLLADPAVPLKSFAQRPR